MSNDDLRDRLGALADEATPGLSDAARRRVIGAARSHGPAAQRGAARRRRVTAVVVVATAALAAAAVATLALPAQQSTDSGAGASLSRRCEEWVAADGELDAGAFDLGVRGSVRLDGEATVAASDGCDTRVHLRAGLVRVDAQDLGGGTLSVSAGPVLVEVRGTRFSVSRSGPSVEVRVEEGHVLVTASDEREIHLRGGETWSLVDGSGGPLAVDEAGDEAGGSGEGGIDGELDADDIVDVSPSIEPDVPAVRVAEASSQTATPRPRVTHEDRPQREQPEDATELLTRAEALFRAGRLAEARRLFNDVGTRTGPLAEAALVRLSRLELQGSHPGAARRAARAQQRRFPDGRLGAEALWLDAEASRALGDAAGRQRAVERLQARYPASPQARAVDANGRSDGR